MIVDRYYYHQLNKQEKAIYKVFYNGAMAHQELIPIPARGEFAQDSFERIFMAMTRDNPLIYFLNQSACSIASDIFGHLAICPQYFFTKEKVKEYNRKIEKVVNRLAGQLHLLECNDYEKELRIHDWICRNIEYDYEGADKNKISRVIASHNILGVFAYHKAQCEGIAKAVKVLLNAVDVKCIVVIGDSVKDGQSMPHAWNIVDIEGQSYHLDITWDIGAIGSAFKRIPYDYFNLSDQMVEKDHKADTQLPFCTSMQYNYFKVNGMTFRTEKQMFAYIKKALQEGNTEFYFRFENSLIVSDIAKKIYTFIHSWLVGKEIEGKKLRQMINDKIGTCWIKIY